MTIQYDHIQGQVVFLDSKKIFECSFLYWFASFPYNFFILHTCNALLILLEIFKVSYEMENKRQKGM